LMFSVLPGHVEAVSWISVQVHLLATLLFLLAIYCYFCFLEKKKKAYYLLSLFLSFLSLLTKEIGITFFLAIFLVEIFYGGLPQQKNIFEKIGIYALRILKRLLIPFVLLVIYFMLRLHATGVFAGSYSKATFSFDFFASLKTFLEISLSMFFSSHWRNYFASVLLSHLFFFGIGIVFLILAGVFFSKKWGGTFLFLLFLYGVTALPFVELSINPINYEGERYGYLLSVWGAMFIALFFFILSDIWKRKRIKVQSFWFITIFFCCLFSFFTYKKIFLWKNSGEMVQNILQGSQDLSVQEDDVVYFVGMPDNIGGAQVLRNGIVEALEIFSGQSLHGKRIGIFSHFSLDTLGSTTITAKKTKNGFLLEGESALSFTGFPELEEAEFHFTLNDFTMPGFLGSSVQIENRNTFERKENTLLVYFDGVNLRIIE